MNRSTREFVLRRNIQRYRKLLTAVTDDEETHRRLLDLLAEQEAELAALETGDRSARRTEGAPRRDRYRP